MKKHQNFLIEMQSAVLSQDRVTDNMTMLTVSHICDCYCYSRGTSYELSLLDKVTDSNGEMTAEDYSPTVNGDMDVSDHTWDLVHQGMRGVAKNNVYLSNLGVTVAGKTGTAQEDMKPALPCSFCRLCTI